MMERLFLSTLTNMKISVLLKRVLLLLFLAQAGTLMGGEGGSFYYALPRGYPFMKSSFLSQNDRRVLLAFADRLDMISKAVREGVVWYHMGRSDHMFFLPEQFVVRIPASSRYEENRNLVIGYELIDREHPVLLSYRPNDLVLLPERYKVEGYEGRVLQIREEAGQAFIRMIEDAENDGVRIRVLSSFRDAQYQSYLYKRAIERYGPVQGSVAKPGHSEHQLGTACDLTTDEIGYSLSGRFESTAAFEWLKRNSYRYGISHSYPKHKVRVTGYIYEPWHFRYWGEDRWTSYIERMGLFFSR